MSYILKYSYLPTLKTSPPVLYSSRTLPLYSKNWNHLISPWASVGFCWLFCVMESSRNDAFCCLILGPNSDIASIFSLLRRGSFWALSQQGGSLPWNWHLEETILSDYADMGRGGAKHSQLPSFLVFPEQTPGLCGKEAWSSVQGQARFSFKASDITLSQSNLVELFPNFMATETMTNNKWLLF